MGHIDTRDSVRLKPNPCAMPLSTFPVQAYMSVALDHLLQVGGQGHRAAARGAHPARSQPVQRWLDDGARRARQPARRHPNGLRGRADREVRDPSGRAQSRGRRTPAPYIATGGQNAANQMCGLSTSQIAFAPAKLKDALQEQAGLREGRGNAAHRAREGRLVASALPRDDPVGRRQGHLLAILSHRI